MPPQVWWQLGSQAAGLLFCRFCRIGRISSTSGSLEFFQDQLAFSSHCTFGGALADRRCSWSAILKSEQESAAPVPVFPACLPFCLHSCTPRSPSGLFFLLFSCHPLLSLACSFPSDKLSYYILLSTECVRQQQIQVLVPSQMCLHHMCRHEEGFGLTHGRRTASWRGLRVEQEFDGNIKGKDLPLKL